MEPTYEDIDEGGDPISGAYKRPDWMTIANVSYPHLCKSAMWACGGRKYFGSKKERAKWKKITNSLRNDRMQEAWVEFCIEWAEEKNKERVTIIFDHLLNFILNASKMKDWEARQKFATGRKEESVEAAPEEWMVGGAPDEYNVS